MTVRGTARKLSAVPVDRRAVLTCVALFAAAQILFLIHLGTPTGLNFDESHYVPAARQFLDSHTDPNREHPPLGKILIAAGIALLGDRPLGWRVMSTVFGALTLVGMYVWARALFKDRALVPSKVEGLALWTALVTLVNHLLYVQARIAMLDTFMFAFLAWAAAAVTAIWDVDIAPERRRRCLALTGVMLGLAMATKWFAVVAWVACLGLVVAARSLLMSQIGATYGELARYLVVYPLLVYFLCFVPRMVGEHQGPWYAAPVDFLNMQVGMYQGQINVPGQHPYMSRWYQWPLLNRPMWYAFERDGGNVHGVLLVGNPLVMWGGVLALVYCAIDWLRRRSRQSFLILFFYLSFFLSWVVIPRRLSLYYYYYPAGMILSFALAHALRDRAPRAGRYRVARWAFLVAATGVFVYFLPVLSGSPIGSDEFRKWMWFQSWI